MLRSKYIVRIFLCLLAAVTMFSFSACGKEDHAQGMQPEVKQEGGQPSTESTDGSTNDETTDTTSGGNDGVQGDNKILIVYFTAAENSGVDAVSSASYTMMDGEAVGRVRAVADMIQEQTGGDLFSIQTSTVYPADGGELIDQAAEEQDAGFRPELTTHIDDLDSYHVIFTGFPNWWYDMPMAMYSFFEEYDFSGKTIIPFNVHNGSRFSDTISTIQELEPGATVIEDGFTVSERDVSEARSDIQEWLGGLGY